MPKAVLDPVPDAALQLVIDNAEQVVVCNGEPATYADATTDSGSGGNAFDTGDEGAYEVYTRVNWADEDTTRHPGLNYREWLIQENFEG